MKKRLLLALILLPASSHALLGAVIGDTGLTPDAWYEASSTNYTVSGGTATWLDLSGNGNHAIRGTAGQQPGLALNATPTGEAALSFDGGDSLAFTNALSSQSWTVFVVMRPTSIAASAAILGGGSGAMEYRISSAGKQQYLNAQVATLATGAATVSTSNYSIAAARLTNGSPNDSVSFFLNDLADGTATPTGDFSAATNLIGARTTAAELYQGQIAALIIFKSALTDTDIANVDSYLKAKYISVPEPDSHVLSALAMGLISLVKRKRPRGRV